MDRTSELDFKSAKAIFYFKTFDLILQLCQNYFGMVSYQRQSGQFDMTMTV